MPKQLLVESIRIDGQTQSRERINEDAVTEYAEGMKASTGAPWPALTVFFDGAEYWLADGFHRLMAALRIGRKHIAADVKQGGREDAAWASCAANQTHGLRRTNADKRKAVAIALKLHPEMSDSALATHCGVSHPFVGEIRRQVVTVTTSTPPTARVGRDGKHYPSPSQPAAHKEVGPPPASRKRTETSETPPPSSKTNSATSAATKPDYPVDDLGRRLPDHLLELWGRRQEVQEMITALSRIRVALRNAQESRDLLFSEVPFSSALAHLDQAYNAVQVAKPYAVCAFCQGHGCKACGQRGLLGKFRWDTSVPREHKEAVARLIAKEQQ